MIAIRETFCKILMMASVCVVGCVRQSVLNEVVTPEVRVVEQPFPLWYPSGSKENKTIATLKTGDRLYVLGEDFGKDYKYFKVRLLDGRSGYVIYEGGGAAFRRLDRPN